MSTCPFLSNYPRYQRFSFLTRAAGCFGVGPQADKNRLTAESKCGDAGNRASKVFGSQGTQRRARTETCLRLAKLSLSLGLCYGNCTKSGKKVDRFAKRKLSFLERKLMFNNLHCVIFFRSLKGRGYRITAVFFHPRRKSSEILSLPLLPICHVLFGSGYVFLFSWSFARGKLTCVNLEPGGYSIYPWEGRCGKAPHTLTLFKTKIADFSTLFKTFNPKPYPV